MRPKVQTVGGGSAMLLGVIIFLGSRFRHHLDPSDRFLDVLVLVGFATWLAGLVALRAQYRDRVGPVGAAGLAMLLGGLASIAIGHLVMFVLGVGGAWFMAILAGMLLLMVGLLCFGASAVRRPVLPRWRATPLVAGVVGVLWMLFANDSRPVEGNLEAFLAMRTAFGVTWIPLGLILLTDRSRGSGRASTPAGTVEAGANRR